LFYPFKGDHIGQSILYRFWAPGPGSLDDDPDFTNNATLLQDYKSMRCMFVTKKNCPFLIRLWYNEMYAILPKQKVPS